MKILYSLCMALILLMGGCDRKQEVTSQGTPLMVGVSADNRPFEYYQEGKMVGFDIDLIRLVAARLGRPLVLKDMSFDGLLGALQSHSIDLAISAMTPTEDRIKAVDMTQKYHEAKTELVCLKTYPITSLEDVRGLVLGVQQGSTHEQFAKQELVGPFKVTLKSLNKVPELIQEIRIGRISCLIIGHGEARAIAEEMPELKTVPIDRNSTGGEAIALPKGSNLTAPINEVLTELKKEGTLQKLARQWLKE